MKNDEKKPREGIDGWIDERIRVALNSLTYPFEKRIVHLRIRMDKLHQKLQELSCHLDNTSLSTKPNPSKRKGTCKR